MHAKKLDKLATGIPTHSEVSLLPSCLSLILYVLVRGLHTSWSFPDWKIFSYQAGGGIGIQLWHLLPAGDYLIISVPLSMGAGVYLSEYAKKGPVTNFVRTCIEILSSLPSVIGPLVI